MIYDHDALEHARGKQLFMSHQMWKDKGVEDRVRRNVTADNNNILGKI